MEIMERDQEMVQVSLTLLKGGGVSESTLVIGNRPFGGAHNSKVMVKVWVDASKECVLTGEALVCQVEQ